MADINIPSRKRKLSGQEQESVIEISDEDACLESSTESIDVEIVEPNAKILHLDSAPSQSSDSNLEFVSLNSQSSTEILHDDPVLELRQKLLELEDEVRNLRTENEDLKSKLCSSKQTEPAEEELVASITFSNIENFKLYKDSLIKLYELSLEFCVSEKESDLQINIFKDDIDVNEWVIIDEKEVNSIPDKPHKKRKRKTKLKTEDELFVLDTTPSLSTKNNLQYESKFTVLNNTSEKGDKNDQKEQKSNNLLTCFNCNESHSLRDCPKPKNYTKINAARQKHKLQQSKMSRYHLEDDQRFAHLQPGKISEKLHQALGLRYNQLPQYIYRMRQLGYPPGWFNEIQAINQSDLVLFDFEGKGAFQQKKRIQALDPDKIVEYSGFNVPIEKGVKDEYRLYGCPAYSKQLSKQNMLEFVRNVQKKAEDNLEACDMDIDHSPCDKEVELVDPLQQVDKQVAVIVNESTISPTLVELESEKQKLLAELVEDTSSNSLLEETNEAFQTIDITGTVDEINDTCTETSKTSESTVEQQCNGSLPAVNVVKMSNFGTPVLKSSTPYCKLPDPDNFSQNVSQVINFENLPNSTGKYEQMVNVLEKVRKTLKSMNEQKS